MDYILGMSLGSIGLVQDDEPDDNDDAEVGDGVLVAGFETVAGAEPVVVLD